MRPRLRLLVGVLEAKGLPNVPRLRLGVSPLPNACVQLWLEPLALRDSTRQTSRVVWRSGAPRYGQSFTFRPVLGTAAGSGGGVLRVGIFDSLSPLLPSGSAPSIGRLSDKAGGGVPGGPVSGAPPAAQASIANATLPLRDLMAALVASRPPSSCGSGGDLGGPAAVAAAAAAAAAAAPLGVDIWLPLVKGAAAAASGGSPTTGVAGALRRSLRAVAGGGNVAAATGPCPAGSGGAIRLYISAVFDDTVVVTNPDDGAASRAGATAAGPLGNSRGTRLARTAVSPKRDLGEQRQPFASAQAAKRRATKQQQQQQHAKQAPGGKEPARLFGSATAASALARARAARGGLARTTGSSSSSSSSSSSRAAGGQQPGWQ